MSGRFTFYILVAMLLGVGVGYGCHIGISDAGHGYIRIGSEGKIEIKIKPLAKALWKSVQTECAGKIDSLMELLQGKLSSGVMQIVTRRERGLFPTPKEIELDCSCPDWADLCKHVAASLYGVGAKLDRNPELLFLLRGVDAADLISRASAAEAVRQTAATAGDAPAMSESEVADVFGIELAPQSAVPAPEFSEPLVPIVAPASPPLPKPSRQRKGKATKSLSLASKTRLAAVARARWPRIKKYSASASAVSAAAPAPAPLLKPSGQRVERAKRRLSPASRARLVAAAKGRWEKLRQKILGAPKTVRRSTREP